MSTQQRGARWREPATIVFRGSEEALRRSHCISRDAARGGAVVEKKKWLVESGEVTTAIKCHQRTAQKRNGDLRKSCVSEAVDGNTVGEHMAKSHVCLRGLF